MKIQPGKQDKPPVNITRPESGITRGQGVTPAGEIRPGRPGQQPVPAGSFGDILSAEMEKSAGLRISAHAERRLVERNVTLNREDLRRIEGAVQKAATRGSRESLVIYGDLALVASVKNRTIITAMEGKDMENHVFTNIDSAVIIR